jgi:hypothetical protein
MNVFKRSHTVYLIFFLIISYSAISQTNPFARSSVDKNKILLGEQFNLVLESKFAANEPISFFDIDSIPHFEILQRQKIDTNDDRTEINLKQTLVLTSFDSGHWVIPTFKLAGTSLRTDSIPMDVAFSSPFDPKQPYHDIKDVIDVERTKQEQRPPWWWFAAGGFVVLLIIIYLFTRKKKPVVKAVDIDAYQEATTQLARLEKEQLDAKAFFTKLVDIFRWYLQRRTEIVSVDQTTADLVRQLRSLKLNGQDYEHLNQALMLSDFVKFARYQPTEREIKVSFDVIRNSIERIEEQFKQKNAAAKSN